MLEFEHGFRVVDIHARLDPDEEAVATHGRDVSPERLERELHEAGIVRAAVAPGPRRRDEGYLRANNAVARLSVDRPFVAFARLNGPLDPGVGAGARLRNLRREREEHHARPSDVEQYAYDERFHGFVLDPATDGLPHDDVLRTLASVGAPVLVYGGDGFTPDAVESTLLDYGFPVILSGFGGRPLNRTLMTRTFGLLDRYDRLYVDTCGVRYRDVLERGLLEHPDRVLFGSGAPECHPSASVMDVLTVDVSEDAMRKAFDKNPARVVPGLAEGAD